MKYSLNEYLSKSSQTFVHYNLSGYQTYCVYALAVCLRE